MAIYRTQGDELHSAYNADGNRIASAFSKDGIQKFPDDGIYATVMSYNVQYFNGINSQVAMQTEIINKYNPDFIGMQELGTYTASTLPAVGQTMLSGYASKQLSNHKNKLMLVSKDSSLSNVVIADFQNQDPEDASRYGETRAYIKADAQIGGKTITLINTHLCVFSSEIRALQMQEILDIANQSDYSVVFGDFNTVAQSADSSEYINVYKPFVDAGYHLANNSPVSGFHNTFTTSATATTLSELMTNPDSLIVSGNISIVSVTFDATKFSYLNGSAIDHIPVVAELVIH